MLIYSRSQAKNSRQQENFRSVQNENLREALIGRRSICRDTAGEVAHTGQTIVNVEEACHYYSQVNWWFPGWGPAVCPPRSRDEASPTSMTCVAYSPMPPLMPSSRFCRPTRCHP